jgi:hypothetical protein
MVPSTSYPTALAKANTPQQGDTLIPYVILAFFGSQGESA